MQTSLNPPRTMRRLQRTSLDFAVLFCLLALMTLTAVAATWQFWHANRIYTGVTVGGAPVGGLTRAAALKLLHEKLYAYPLPPVSIEYQGQQWPLEQLQVKAEADLVAGVNQAYLVGRQGSLAGNLVEQMRGAFLGHAITPPLKFDQPALAAALEQIAAKVEKSGMAARQIGAVAVPAQAGVVVDVDATLQAVVDALQRTELA